MTKLLQPAPVMHTIIAAFLVWFAALASMAAGD
jgi:hypothetical protein